MATVYDKSTDEIINKAAEELKKLVKAPEWSNFVKTGAHKERPPQDPSWWYKRSAAVLRSIYLRGPIGVNKIRNKYGGKRNRGMKPEKFYKGSGKITRTILQQLEKIGFLKKSEKSVHKGRIITSKGKSFLDKLAK